MVPVGTAARTKADTGTFRLDGVAGQEPAALAQQSLTQRNEENAALEQAPASGRLVVRLPANFARFPGSLDDIEMCGGDSLWIPKRPAFFIVFPATRCSAQSSGAVHPATRRAPTHLAVLRCTRRSASFGRLASARPT